MSERIFVSSTFADLKDHRAKVREVIQKLGATDISMETLGARDERPLNECLRLVKHESDMFLGIYAHRYGFIPEKSSVSITEAEYLAATEKGLPRLIFLVDPDAPWSPKMIDEGDSKKSLERFASRLKADHICEFFDDAKDLAAKVAASVGRELNRRRLRKVSGETPGSGKSEPIGTTLSSKQQWGTYRDGVYGESRGVFLAHTLRPSRKKGQLFDVFIYLITHKAEDRSTAFSDVSHAEFFFGAQWGNKVFRVEKAEGLIGISTAAYGPFLCTCKVHYADGRATLIHRYIDFEAAKAPR